MNQNPKLKVAFLVGGDSSSTRRAIEAVSKIQGVDAVAVLVDTGVTPLKRRLKNLIRNVRANGWIYPIHRIANAIRTLTDHAVQNAAISSGEISKVLKAAFPNRCFSLEEVGQKYGIPIHNVGNLNGSNAVTVLRECAADLGIVLGTRILKPIIFSVPRMGCINLHKGNVPQYRGMPPGFWELFDGVPTAGVTVHFVDQGLDTGDILATGEILICKTETPDSLLEKLHTEGERVLAVAVEAVRDGTAEPVPQPKERVKPRTKPTNQETAQLMSRLPHWKSKSNISGIARDLYLLAVYYTGVYFAIRQLHRLRGGSRCAIYLYHRVNDYSKDVLTVDTGTFAGQLLAISKRYPFSTTSAIVDRVLNKQPLEPTTIAIHFDDCYREVHTHGGPILKALGLPACAFINSGYIDTDRTFAHDSAKYPFQYPLLRTADVREWCGQGFEVGAHTVNHVDLGRIELEAAKSEVADCGAALEQIAKKHIDLFSFPFGRVDNISSATMQIIADAGYRALFSAHGGFVDKDTDQYDIPRIGASHESSPLYCLLEIEGIALHQIAGTFRRLFRKSRQGRIQSS